MKDRYKALKVAKERVFRPITKDVYLSEDELKSGEKTKDQGFALDLWDISRKGAVDLFRMHYKTLLENATKVHENTENKKDEQRVRRGSKIRAPSTLVSVCPSDTTADLEEVLLSKNTWYCFTCSNNEDGLTKCCIWCIDKCHSGHLVEEGEATLEICYCGKRRHNTESIIENPLDYQDPVSKKKKDKIKN